MRERSTRRVALYGMLTALALILSYVEAMVPAFFAFPGMKLGLTNLVVLFALYTLRPGSALLVNLARILLSALLFGNGISLAYSLAGGMLSWGVMALLHRTGQFAPVTVSMAGGVAHNVGQILVAMAVMHTTTVGWYLLVLWFSGLGSGCLVGLLGGWLCRRLRPWMEEQKR